MGGNKEAQAVLLDSSSMQDDEEGMGVVRENCGDAGKSTVLLKNYDADVSRTFLAPLTTGHLGSLLRSGTTSDSSTSSPVAVEIFVFNFSCSLWVRNVFIQHLVPSVLTTVISYQP